jgi:hypothetical protein
MCCCIVCYVVFIYVIALRTSVFYVVLLVFFASGVSHPSQSILGLTSACVSTNKPLANLQTNFQQAINQMTELLKWLKWVTAISRLRMLLFLDSERN